MCLGTLYVTVSARNLFIMHFFHDWVGLNLAWWVLLYIVYNFLMRCLSFAKKLNLSLTLQTLRSKFEFSFVAPIILFSTEVVGRS